MTPYHLFYFSLCAGLLALPPAARSDPAGGPVQWKSLPDVQSAIGVSNVLWDGDSLLFSNDQCLVRFYPGRRKSDINGITVWLNAPPDGSVTAGDWRIASTDLDLLLLSVLPTEEGAQKSLRVMLDPGHGGEDDGASSKNPPVKEKDLTLALALQIGACLTNAGMQAAYTRTNDTTLTLDERSRAARRAHADLFVSVHANYASNTNAIGVETYVLPPSGYSGTADGSRICGWQIGNRNDYHNTLLGYSVHRSLAHLDEAPDRGLKRQSFFVLRETSCPAVLIEFGFLSNPAETEKLRDAVWQSKCAATIADGILAYSRKVDALERAVTEKRLHEMAANDRWRIHLAAQSAKKTAAPSTNLTGQTLAAPSLPASVSALPSSSVTNTAPLELNTLIEFYATGKSE